MKVAFISPRGELGNQQNCILNEIYKPLRNILVFFDGEDLEFLPNLGLLTIAGLFPEEWELEYIDEDFIDEGTADPVDFDKKYDMVCLTGVSNQIERAYKIADEFRKRGSKVIIGGMHVSALPEEAESHVDSVIVGEGEDIIPQLLKDFKNNSLKKRYISRGNFDLKLAPVPRYDLIKNIWRFNKMSIQATRGCPYNCKYCSIIEVYGKKFRTKSIDRVIEEINIIQKLSPRVFLSFSDENLPVDRKYIKELLKEMIPLNIKWEAYSDVTIAYDDEVLELLHRAGCMELLLGFESVIPESLNEEAPWKAKLIPKYKEIVNRIQSKGVAVMGLFIMGLDGDYPDVFEKTRDFILESNMYESDFAVLTPLPGTYTYKRLEKEGRLLPKKDWNDFTWEKVNFKPNHITPRELAAGILWLYKELNTAQVLKKRRKHMKDIMRRIYMESKNG